MGNGFAQRFFFRRKRARKVRAFNCHQKNWNLSDIHTVSLWWRNRCLTFHVRIFPKCLLKASLNEKKKKKTLRAKNGHFVQLSDPSRQYDENLVENQSLSI